MSIINNNDFTLSTEAQQAIETICANLGFDDAKIGMKYNGIYPIYDNDTDDYVGSINLETLEFTYDLSGFIDSFFVAGVFAWGNERDNEIEDSENENKLAEKEVANRSKLDAFLATLDPEMLLSEIINNQ